MKMEVITAAPAAQAFKDLHVASRSTSATPRLVKTVELALTASTPTDARAPPAGTVKIAMQTLTSALARHALAMASVTSAHQLRE